MKNKNTNTLKKTVYILIGIFMLFAFINSNIFSSKNVDEYEQSVKEAKRKQHSPLLDKQEAISPSPTPNNKMTDCRFENCGTKSMTSEQCRTAVCCPVGSSYVITEDGDSCKKLMNEFSKKKVKTIYRSTNSKSNNFVEKDTGLMDSILLENKTSPITVEDTCNKDLAEYNTCLNEYSAKMAAYNACASEKTSQGLSIYICSQPYNNCSKPFGCGL